MSGKTKKKETKKMLSDLGRFGTESINEVQSVCLLFSHPVLHAELLPACGTCHENERGCLFELRHATHTRVVRHEGPPSLSQSLSQSHTDSRLVSTCRNRIAVVFPPSQVVPDLVRGPPSRERGPEARPHKWDSGTPVDSGSPPFRRARTSHTCKRTDGFGLDRGSAPGWILT